MSLQLTTREFGPLADGRTATLFTCQNANGLILEMTDFGAIVVAMRTPDRQGQLANINLRFPELAGYQQRHPYFGATVGRYCNRIARGRFTLGGKSYSLATNNGPNHLHGGERGFDRYLWNAQPLQTDDGVGVQFQITSPDGDEGYPGTLDVTATYLLNNQNELHMRFQASADQETHVNLTNHCYWNLAGAGNGTILDHELELACDQYLPVDDTLIPLGKLAPVAGTPLDFTRPHLIGERLPQVGSDPHGYDHCFVIKRSGSGLAEAARVRHPATGRTMSIATTQPGIQFYTGNFLSGDASGGGYPQHGGLCLETQHYPDTPNQAGFPTTLLRPGEAFDQTTVHRFANDG